MLGVVRGGEAPGEAPRRGHRALDLQRHADHQPAVLAVLERPEPQQATALHAQVAAAVQGRVVIEDLVGGGVVPHHEAEVLGGARRLVEAGTDDGGDAGA